MARPHHVKLADVLLTAVRVHGERLDTTITVQEHGKTVLIVSRRGADGGPAAVFVEDE